MNHESLTAAQLEEFETDFAAIREFYEQWEDFQLLGEFIRLEHLCSATLDRGLGIGGISKGIWNACSIIEELILKRMEK